MDATVRARGVGAAQGDRQLFSDLDLLLAPGDVILVGPNGAGKSTLLRILAGLRPPDSGTVTVTPADATVGYLAQQPELRPGETIVGLLARRTGVAAAQATLEHGTTALAAGDRGADDAYPQALESWLALGGADLDQRLAALLPSAGLHLAPDTAMTSQSGGQAACVGLVALLLSRFGVNLLDEPTNDLDLPAIEQLEAALNTFDGTLLLVTHDRRMLDTVHLTRRWHVEAGMVTEVPAD